MGVLSTPLVKFGGARALLAPPSAAHDKTWCRAPDFSQYMYSCVNLLFICPPCHLVMVSGHYVTINLVNMHDINFKALLMYVMCFLIVTLIYISAVSQA